MSINNSRVQIRATLLTFLAAFLWGSSFVGSKICLNGGLLPFETVFYRMFLAVVIIGCMFFRQLKSITRKTLKAGIVVGAVTAAVYTVEMYGITMIETSKASFLTSTNIVMMPFLVAIFFREPLRARSFLAAIITICGVALMNLNRDTSFSLGLGGILMLFAAFLYCMNSIAVTALAKEQPALQITFIQLTFTMLVFGLLTAIQGHTGIHSAETGSAIVFLAIGPTFICFLIKNYALKLISPLRCTLILSTEGVFCAILSVLILHDVITLKMFLGILLIFGGISIENFGGYLVEKSKKA